MNFIHEKVHIIKEMGPCFYKGGFKVRLNYTVK